MIGLQRGREWFEFNIIPVYLGGGYYAYYHCRISSLILAIMYVVVPLAAMPTVGLVAGKVLGYRSVGGGSGSRRGSILDLIIWWVIVLVGRVVYATVVGKT